MSTWVCDACTYINDGDDNACEMCDATKCREPQQLQHSVIILDDEEVENGAGTASGTTGCPRKRSADYNIDDEVLNLINPPISAPAAPQPAIPAAAVPACAAADGLYTLDSCACVLQRHMLQQRVQQAASEAVSSVESLTLPGVLARVCCPNQSCRRLLSNRDAMQLLGVPLLGQLYAAIARKAGASASTAAPVMPPPCTSCSNAPMLRPKAPLMHTNNGEPFNLSATRTALRKRGLPAAGSLQDCTQRLLDHLQQQGAEWFCPTCAHCTSSVCAEPAGMQDEQAVQSSAAACQEVAAAAEVLLQVLTTGKVPEGRLASSAASSSSAAAAVQQQGPSGSRGAASRSERRKYGRLSSSEAAAAAAGQGSLAHKAAAAMYSKQQQQQQPPPPPPPPQQQQQQQQQQQAWYHALAVMDLPHGLMSTMSNFAGPGMLFMGGDAGDGNFGGAGSSKAWAAGTGYGGNRGGLTSKDRKAMDAAAQKQQAADAAMAPQLQAVRAVIACRRAPARAAPSAAMQGSVPLAVCATVRAGALPFCLRTLLQNDSLQDISARRGLYMEAFALLRLMGSSMDLVPSLQQPAANPADPDPAAPSLLAVMQRLHTQCAVFKKAAEQLGEGDEDVAALSLALEISSMFEDLRSDVEMYTLAMGSGEKEAAAAAAAGASVAASAGAAAAGASAAAAHGGAGSSDRASKRQRTDQGGQQQAQQQHEAHAREKQQQQEAAAKQYVDTLQQHAFSDQPLEADHYFRQPASKAVGGGEQMRVRLRKITQEISTLSTSLPISWGSSVLVRVDSERMDLLRACFLPPEDTPYGNGAFLFDIWLPPDYPNSPPKVQFLTTGGGQVRFNPNLYHCGKVCLSLLGTWAGPSWQPGISTLLQVLISIQAMILVSDPYFNEPGHEAVMNTPHGKRLSSDYNASLRYHTLSLAVLQQLRSPPPAFAEAVRAHFRLKRQEVLKQCERWTAEASHKHRHAMKARLKEIQAELAKL